MKVTETDWTIIRYNLYFNLKNTEVNTDQDKWIYAMSEYLIKKLERIQVKKLYKTIKKEGLEIIGEKKFPNDTILYLKRLEE